MGDGLLTDSVDTTLPIVQEMRSVAYLECGKGGRGLGDEVP